MHFKSLMKRAMSQIRNRTMKKAIEQIISETKVMIPRLLHNFVRLRVHLIEKSLFMILDLDNHRISVGFSVNSRTVILVFRISFFQ